jgi:predicted DNA-binding transcriptional regulator AlpA
MNKTSTLLEKLVAAVERQSASLDRIADRLAPQPGDIVGTPYIAERLGCTTAWITELIKAGEIPRQCIVEGTGNGKPWKFHRRHIEEWIKTR